MSALPISASRPELYHFDPELACPRCFRDAGALSRSAADRGLYRCAGCASRFKFIAATERDAAALERVFWTDEEWNAGARIADDCFCPSCGARGYIVVCPACTQSLYSGGRR